LLLLERIGVCQKNKKEPRNPRLTGRAGMSPDKLLHFPAYALELEKCELKLSYLIIAAQCLRTIFNNTTRFI